MMGFFFSPAQTFYFMQKSSLVFFFGWSRARLMRENRLNRQSRLPHNHHFGPDEGKKEGEEQFIILQNRR